MNRPQPVRIMTTVIAVVSFLAASAQLADLISATVMAWLVIGNGALTVAWGAWSATQVTPLASPQTADGRALVPAGPPIPQPGLGEGGYLNLSLMDPRARRGAALAALLVFAILLTMILWPLLT